MLAGSIVLLASIAAHPRPSTTHLVRLDGNRFVPREIAASPGDTIRFVNGAGGPHNIQFMAESISVANRALLDLAMNERILPLTSPMFLAEGETYVIVVPRLTAGRYPFLCSPHWAQMRGVLIVAE